MGMLRKETAVLPKIYDFDLMENGGHIKGTKIESEELYQKIIENTSLKELIEGNYITLIPKLKLKEHEDVKSYIIMTFDDFSPTTNPEYRDCIVSFDIICHTDYWQMDNYQIRPLKIAGIIDGLLNDAKLSGIGTFQFVGCNELVLDEVFSGYCLTYLATHGSDDIIEPEE